MVINKFRGDAKLFADGVTFLESHGGIPVLGVVPFLRDLMLDQEDSLDREACRQTEFSSERINIAVILLPHMSNFTDFNVLAAEGDVALQYVAAPTALDGADIVIIPGSKTTQADLSFVLAQGYPLHLCSMLVVIESWWASAVVIKCLVEAFLTRTWSNKAG